MRLIFDIGYQKLLLPKSANIAAIFEALSGAVIVEEEYRRKGGNLESHGQRAFFLRRDAGTLYNLEELFYCGVGAAVGITACSWAF